MLQNIIQTIRESLRGALGEKLGGIGEGFAAVLPKLTLVLSLLLRLAVIGLALAVLLRCIRSLFADRKDREHWGVLTLANGVRYELTHWESLIGRAKNADIRLNFTSVSRAHAVLRRQDDGRWLVFPLQPMKCNDEPVTEPMEVVFGDVLSFRGIELHFFPLSETEVKEQRKQRRRGGYAVDGKRTLKLLTGMQAMLLAQFLLVSPIESLIQIILSFLLLIGCMWGLHALYKVFKRTAFELETLAFLLCTVGEGVMAAYSPSAMLKQNIAMILGLCLFLVLSFAMRNIYVADRCRVPIAAAAAALLAFNLVVGERVFGAKNWVAIGPLSFQPSEIVKVAFVFAGAVTLDRMFSKKNLIFTAGFSCFCVGALGLMSDFGTALVFFVAFLVIAFLRSGDLSSVVLVTLAAAAGAYVIIQFKPYIARRFAVWRHVWEYTDAGGYQQSRTMAAIAGGGLFGKGPEAARLKAIGAANTDLVFGVVSEEFGLLLAILCVLAIAVIALFSVASLRRTRSTFYGISSAAAASMLVFQSCLNIFGATDILPLTGVTLPFVSIGGSSMMSCWALLAFIKAADARRDAGFSLRRLRFRVHEEEAPEETEIADTERSRVDDFSIDWSQAKDEDGFALPMDDNAEGGEEE